MNKELTIDSIINTYELSQKVKDRARWIAHKRIEELCLRRYNSIYGYIAYLVDKFQTPYRERFFIKASESIKDERFCPEKEIFKEENSYMSLEEVIDILDLYLDSSTLNLIKQLGNGNGNTLKFSTSPEYLITNASLIQEKLESLIERYERNISVIKTRPIKQVQFSPSLKIKFGRRNYNGNPLAFFISHREFYPENLSRRVQLKKIDEPLYAALRRYNQIDEAIPLERVYRGILPEKRNAIVEAYKECRSSPKVSEEFSVSTATVIKYCRISGLEIREKGFIAKKSKEEKSEIVKVYKKYKSSSKVAKEFNISPKTVLRYCKEYCVKILAQGSNQRKIKYRKQKIKC